MKVISLKSAQLEIWKPNRVTPDTQRGFRLTLEINGEEQTVDAIKRAQFFTYSAFKKMLFDQWGIVGAPLSQLQWEALLGEAA